MQISPPIHLSSGVLVTGNSTLILQSYDDNGFGKSTIREDTITITVIAPQTQATNTHIISALDASMKLGLSQDT